MEPPFSLQDERALLPPELHTPAHSLETPPGPGTPADSLHRLEPQAKDIVENLSSAREGEGEVEESRRVSGRHHYRRQPTEEYDRHSVHVVTQYYAPADTRRAREVRVFFPCQFLASFCSVVFICVDCGNPNHAPGGGAIVSIS